MPWWCYKHECHSIDETCPVCDRNTTEEKVRRAVEITRDLIHANVKREHRKDSYMHPNGDEIEKKILSVNVKALMKRALKEVE